jgi:nitrite reductase/ring-hydroxylating ferredoxin subunit
MRRALFCVLAVLILSCDKPYISSIPDYPVYLELDLDFEDKALKEIQAYHIYTKDNINQDIERTGFGGVLVYHGISDNGMGAYYAFDAACPHEAKRTVTVEVDVDRIYAVCPKCQSKYELLNGIGNRISGPSQEQLKSYQVQTVGSKVYVRSNY